MRRFILAIVAVVTMTGCIAQPADPPPALAPDPAPAPAPARSCGWNTIRLTLSVGSARSMPHAQSVGRCSRLKM